MIKGIIGKKLGMTQLFDESGRVVPVTVIEAGPCTVVQKKTVESDGYRTTLAAGEYLLLCTDGLTITVTDQEMLFEILHGGDEESCLSRLLAIAKEHGAPDNVTAVLMRQTEGGE